MSKESFTETDWFFRGSSKGPLEVYNMKNRRRGLALIFNCEYFDPELKKNPRFGSDADCKNLERSLTKLGFQVKIFRNLTESEVNATLDHAAKDDHSDADCLLVVYMSYAAPACNKDEAVECAADYDEECEDDDDDDDDDDDEKSEDEKHDEDDNVYAYDGKLPIKTITDKFKGTECKSLVRKPKIFIWQVCCENEEEAHDATFKKRDLAGAGAIKTLPAAADFIMCYAVAKGSFSHRHTYKGSWYIQDLCRILQQYGDTLEFTQLLTLVNREVARREDGKCLNSISVKQIPCFASMLTKKLYFHSKK